MFRVPNLSPSPPGAYRGLVPDDILAQACLLADGLEGARIAHVNATQAGGGVAEILHSIIPLYRGLGIEASWLVMDGNDRFFDVTKRLHNALQGAPNPLTAGDWDLYEGVNQANVRDLESYDVIVVHDPQPAAMRHLAPDAASKWIWRCHIDTSTPNTPAWERIVGYVNGYDAAMFSTEWFVGPGLDVPNLTLSPPAIDPFTPKNRDWPHDEARDVVAGYGIDVDRPFITQVSRFDPWKDPLGVIEAFKRLRKSHPDLQLAMLGNFAADDPEGALMYRQVLKAARGVEDLHIITGLTDLVGPFQSLSDVILQKSTREGFGLTVTEALWKGTAVVAGAVGGIRLQIKDGVGGYLVSSTEECAERVSHLLRHPDERRRLGEAGREHVRQNYLMPRLLRDELRLIAQVLGKVPTSSRPRAAAIPVT